MKEFLVKWHIVNGTASPDVQRYQVGRFAGILGVIFNGLIFIAEFVLGLMTGSIALISDAVHNVTDVGGSLLSLLSFALTHRHADKEHPYGHGRFEYLLSIGFSMILFFIAIQLAMESYDRILQPKLVDVSGLMIVCMVFAMMVKFSLSRILKSLGIAINSPILQANAKDSLSDVFATAAILIGLVVAAIFQVDIDGYLGILVALLIVHAAWEVLKDSTNRILGEVPSEEHVEAIKRFVLSYKGVLGVHDLLIHDYGPGNEYASIHIEMDASMDPMSSHNILDRIEQDMHEKMGIILTTHLDPLVQDKLTKFWAKRLVELVKAYGPDYEVHDVRVIRTGSMDRRLEFIMIIPIEDSKKADYLQRVITTTLQLMAPEYAIQMRINWIR